MNTETAKPSKTFEIWNSERSYRYKEEAMHNHAPNTPGIYQLVTFDERQNPKVVFMALTLDKTIFMALDEHWQGIRQPAVQTLLASHPNLYFSFVVDSDAKTAEDLQDLFWAMVQSDKPEATSPHDPKPTGRYSEIHVKDKSIL